MEPIIFPSGITIICAADLPEPDTSHFIPWNLNMVYQVEPRLQEIASKATQAAGKRFYTRLDAYAQAKNAADMLIGWNARDPRLRSKGAWECFFSYILEKLNL